jgi:D-xylose transport system substrate-binding protein
VTTTVTRLTTVGMTALLALGATACGANDAAEPGGEDGGTTIALLLPESQTTRYETFDKPLFEDKVAELCDDCEVLYYNADQDEAKQTQQVDTAISEGASVIVLDPVNGAGAGGMVTAAQDEGISVIAYDRFIAEADYYLSFDNQTVGKMQAEALVEAMGGSGSILMLNGAPSDPNAAQFKEGAHSVLDESDVEILAEFDNPDWSMEEAQQFVVDQLSNFDAAEIDGVYAANDGQASGVIAALTGGDVPEDALPPVTGQDAQLAAIQYIISGLQAMTIYKPIPIEAETAAEVAVKLAQGEDIGDTSDTGIELTEYEGVPSYIFDPIAVTAENVNDTVVADGFYSVEDICTEEYADACAAAGIS